MSDYFIYYTESSIVCFLIFTIMLGHDLLNVDRQEKQIKYDHALEAFMLYFISDAFWAAVIAGVIPKTLFSVVITNFLNFIFMANITYAWLDYVMAVEQAPHRNRPVNRFAVAFPFLISLIVLVLTWIIAPQALIGSDLYPTALYNAFLITVPIIYIVASMGYALRMARKEKSPVDKRTHYHLAFFPLMVVIGGLIQVVILPETPIFCFACTLLMLIFYIQSMEGQISLDPLTNLNNRGQLHRYTKQESSLFREGLRTFVAMIDVNDFKHINDGYGHAEGDHALIIIADSLRQAAGKAGFPVFIARYGGDEFVIVMHCSDEKGPEKLIREIRRQLQETSIKECVPYSITIAYGCEELLPDGDFDTCLKLADEKCYKDKAARKRLAC